MTIGTLPANADVWKIASQVCTEKQLRVLELRERHSFSWRQIAAMTDTDYSNVRGHYNAAVRNVTIYFEKAS
jgi:transcriptional regulator